MRQRGFSVLELVMVVAVFTMVTGAVFVLLDAAQQRYRAESELLDSFQGARIALDQITRDVHAAGYPPAKSLAGGQADANSTRLAYPFAWAPGYNTRPSLAAPCLVGTGVLAGNCVHPNAFELVLESDLDPENGNGVEWIRYTLQNNTLFRGVASKVDGGDPVAVTAPFMVPLVEGVMNNASAADQARIRASYPNLFLQGAVPLFTYRFENKAGCPNQPPPPNLAQPAPPACIRDVGITLIVQSPALDPRTRQPRVATLTGLARRINPT
jgi:hypothetical protein